jgi:hypothetical protein
VFDLLCASALDAKGTIDMIEEVVGDPPMIDITKLAWRKSSYSNGTGGDCVEVADLPHGGGRLVRDTKDHGRGPIFRFTEAEWRAFVLGVKDREFG